MTDPRLPEYIRTKLHDDWPWPLSYIPRRWTAWVMPLPTRRWSGNQPYSWIPFKAQEGWPISPSAEFRDDEGGTRFIKVLGPVPEKPGEWSVHAYWIPRLKRWVPLFFCIKFRLLGIWPWYFNIGFKPDYDPSRWNTTFPEISFTRA